MVFDRRHQTWATSDRFIPRSFVRPFVRFSQIEASSGTLLLAAAIIALIWANGPWSQAYFSIVETPIIVDIGGFTVHSSIHEVINDGLMAIFFFVVGIEIKRELVVGDLRDRKAAALPVMGALGGMAVPALIYLAFNGGTEAAQGWGIPMATDIAFAVGVVALLGARVPPAAKLFLLALAIADDIGAIAVIAIFYTTDLELVFLGAALGGLVLVWVAGRVNIRSLAFYTPMAILIWFLTLESGVHATLAGVALGFLTPARPLYGPREFDRRARSILDTYPVETVEPYAQEHADHEALLLSDIATAAVAPLSRVEFRISNFTSFVIVPLFALANAGVDLRGTSFGEALTSPVAMGVGLGLVAGKLFGITAFSWLAVRAGLGRLPPRVTWRHMIGVAGVAGIGFTVSLFVAQLAFRDPILTDLARVGIFAGSLVAGVIGVLLLGGREPPIE